MSNGVRGNPSAGGAMSTPKPRSSPTSTNAASSSPSALGF
jgi:hypothetical protein